MKNKNGLMLLTVALCCALATPRAAHAAPASSTIPTPHGPIYITAKFHASLQLQYGNKIIIVDPVSAASWKKKADLVLITHPHGDHLDLPAIAKVLKPDGFVIAPNTVAATIRTIRGATVEGMNPGEDVGYLDQASNGRLRYLNLGVHAVPMYNLVRGPQPGRKYHPRESRWNGYVLGLGGKRLYFAGDTEATPEMRALRDIDAAFLPMNLPYTMTPAEAAAVARAFRPKRVYPYHFRYPFNKDSGNERTFARLLRGSGIRVIQLNWYPRAAVRKMMGS